MICKAKDELEWISIADDIAAVAVVVGKAFTADAGKVTAIGHGRRALGVSPEGGM